MRCFAQECRKTTKGFKDPDTPRADKLFKEFPPDNPHRGQNSIEPAERCRQSSKRGMTGTLDSGNPYECRPPLRATAINLLIATERSNSQQKLARALIATPQAPPEVILNHEWACTRWLRSTTLANFRGSAPRRANELGARSSDPTTTGLTQSAQRRCLLDHETQSYWQIHDQRVDT
jgi:hypothetical protein